MIKLGYDQIIEKITEKSDLEEVEIEQKISTKLKQLSGLISKEGAAHIVANQLGIKLVEQVSGKLQIKNIVTGMRDVETAAKVLRVFPLREFEVNGRSGKVANLVIADETGSTRLVLWGDHAEKVNNIKQGSIVKIMGSYVKENNNQKELHLGNKGSIAINPKGISIKGVKQTSNRKKINELKENMNNVELLATIVQIFEPRYYETCPECNRKVQLNEGTFSCNTHGTVNPKLGYVINAFLDDGTDNIRAVFFRNQARDLLGADEELMLKFKDNPEEFEDAKMEILGNIVKINGRIAKNQMFDRLEIISRHIDPNPDPKEELKKLDQEKESKESNKTQDKNIKKESNPDSSDPKQEDSE
ncbi:MAG: Replication factor A [Candidatus Woesearchaeota archaeon]|nr:Replication factor A [Candidatus Woesearchaeota archaeon]